MLRHTLTLITLLAVSTLSAGCSISVKRTTTSEPSIQYEAKTDADTTDLDERLRVSLLMRGLYERDAALSTIAMDAAASGYTEVCKEALSKMSQVSVRDAVAAHSARLAMEHSTLAEAESIASTISSMMQRDQVYGEIARDTRQ